MDFAKVDQIVDSYGYETSALISILYDVQKEYDYLSRDILKYLSKKLGIPEIQIFSVATFYKIFRMRPRGRHTLKVCLGTACHVRGAPRVLEEVERRLISDIKKKDRGRDLFTLETVNCLGCCALGPMIVVDDHYFGHMNPTKVASIFRKYSKP